MAYDHSLEPARRAQHNNIGFNDQRSPTRELLHVLQKCEQYTDIGVKSSACVPPKPMDSLDDPTTACHKANDKKYSSQNKSKVNAVAGGAWRWHEFVLARKCQYKLMTAPCSDCNAFTLPQETYINRISSLLVSQLYIGIIGVQRHMLSIV